MAHRGTVVQIVGPDGAGKSTVTTLLVERLSESREVHRAYVRPALLPLPGRLVGKPAPGLVTDPHGRKPHGRLKALVRLLYYAADFILGYAVVYLPVLRKGGAVVVERGWQDLVVDSRRYLMPDPLPARVLAHIVPRPDIIVILDAPAETLIARKDELGAGEIDRQLTEWKATARAKREVLELDARLTPDELVATILPHIKPG